MPKKENWLFAFAALGGFGGLACILQWLGITPGDLLIAKLVTVPQILWLVLGMCLFAASLWSTFRVGVLQKMSMKRLRDELERTKESLRESAGRNLQYRAQLSDAASGSLKTQEMQAQLAIFSPIQIEAFRLGHDIRQFVEECGNYPEKEFYGYRGETPPDDKQKIHAYHDARRSLDRRLTFGYQRRFKAAVRDFTLKIGESGYPVFNPDWDDRTNDRDGFLKLAADLEMVGIWFGRNKNHALAKGASYSVGGRSLS